MDENARQFLADELIKRVKPKQMPKALKLYRRTGVVTDYDVKELQDEVVRKTGAVDWKTLTQ